MGDVGFVNTNRVQGKEPSREGRRNRTPGKASPSLECSVPRSGRRKRFVVHFFVPPSFFTYFLFKTGVFPRGAPNFSVALSKWTVTWRFVKEKEANLAEHSFLTTDCVQFSDVRVARAASTHFPTLGRRCFLLFFVASGVVGKSLFVGLSSARRGSLQTWEPF